MPVTDYYFAVGTIVDQSWARASSHAAKSPLGPNKDFTGVIDLVTMKGLLSIRTTAALGGTRQKFRLIFEKAVELSRKK